MDDKSLEATLTELEEKLSEDLPIQTLEEYETALKEVLRSVMIPEISGKTARIVANFQKRLGLLAKYKSYTIKAASPMGFSVFFHNQGEGFSYQRHIVHKTEVFHILKVMPGGYVFLCDFDKWEKFYQKESFEKWLEGEENPEYEQYRFYPQEGDVFIMDKLNTVHTVIGCYLEEFATVSTDMVDRLYDQNAGKPIPSHFSKEHTLKELNNLKLPENHRLVYQDKNGEWKTKAIEGEKIKGGEKFKLAEIAFRASQFLINKGDKTEVWVDKENTTTVYVHEGEGFVVIADKEELNDQELPSVAVKSGDILLIPASIYYQYCSANAESLRLTEHKIPLKTAFGS